MSLVINFRIDKWTESMLSITSSQKCSLVPLVIPIVKPISLNIKIYKSHFTSLYGCIDTSGKVEFWVGVTVSMCTDYSLGYLFFYTLNLCH